MNEFTFLKLSYDLKHNISDAAIVDKAYASICEQIVGTEWESKFDKSSPLELFNSLGNIIQKDSDALSYFFPTADHQLVKSELALITNKAQYATTCSSLCRTDLPFVFLEKGHREHVGATITGQKFLDAIKEYQNLFNANLASPAEILTLARYFPDNSVYQQAVLDKDLDKQENRPLVVGGPASVEMIDKQKHLITTEALSEAFTQFMKNIRTRNVQIFHTNVQAAWPLAAYINENGEFFESGVDDTGLWLISELRDDLTIAKKVAEAIRNGEIKSYSIAGTAIDTQIISKGFEQFMQVDKLELAEITLCERGINQGAHFDILKSNAIQISNEPMFFAKYGIVLEKGATPIVVINADKPNQITDMIYLQLRKSISDYIPIEIRSNPLGEWEPLIEFVGMPIRKHDTLNVLEEAHYRPSDVEGQECHTCIFFADGGYCTKLNTIVDPEYICNWYNAVPYPATAEKWAEVSHQTYEIEEASIPVKVKEIQLSNITSMNKGESSMSKLQAFTNWETAEKERRKKHRETMTRLGIPEDKEFDVKYSPDNSALEDFEQAVKDIKHPQKVIGS